MDTARFDKLTSAMKSAALDAIFVTNPKNVQYLTGIRAMMGGSVQPFNDPEGILLAQPGRCDVLCDGRYFAENNAKPGIKAKLLNAPVTAKEIAARMRELLGSGKKSIGYEADALLYGDAVALMQEMKDLDWKPAEALLAGLRVCKTPAEIELIRKAQAITGDCFEHIAGWIKVGMSERHVAMEIDNYLRTHSEGGSFNPIVAFGETGCHPHYTPSPDRKLQKGQMVLLDFGAIHEGYCGDMTRMLVMGKADARQREVYDLVLAAQQKCLDGIKPGVTCHSLDALCRDYFKSKGCDAAFVHGTGHGVGLAIHEDPRLKQTFQTIVQPGMVVTVEPGLYYEGWGGVRIEDMVVITQNGYDNLTKTSKVLREIAC
jgi:Xaa-Pro aminopeptidase